MAEKISPSLFDTLSIDYNAKRVAFRKSEVELLKFHNTFLKYIKGIKDSLYFKKDGFLHNNHLRFEDIENYDFNKIDFCLTVSSLNDRKPICNYADSKTISEFKKDPIKYLKDRELDKKHSVNFIWIGGVFHIFERCFHPDILSTANRDECFYDGISEDGKYYLCTMNRIHTPSYDYNNYPSKVETYKIKISTKTNLVYG
jgi:hypothetical protein